MPVQLSDPRTEPQLHEHDSRWTAVDTYAKEHLLNLEDSPYADALNYAGNNAMDNGLPRIEVPPLHGKFLAMQCQLIGAKHILEVGTLGGYSTIWLASSGPDVTVTSVEVLPKHKEVAEQSIVHAGLSDRVKVVLGAGTDVLPQLREQVQRGERPPFDFVFIDADKENNLNYLNEAILMSRPRACLIVDNVVRKGTVANVAMAEKDSRIQGARRVIEAAGADSRLETTLLQTVGEKNYDGFLICMLKASE